MTLVDGSLESPCSTFYLRLTELLVFSLPITVPELCGEMCTARLFT